MRVQATARAHDTVVAYGRNYHVRPADGRARQVPHEYLRLARAVSVKWCGTAEGDVGPFERLLGKLPTVDGLTFGGYAEVSTSTDVLCGEVATLGARCEVPERFGCSCGCFVWFYL